ncbi:Sec-independent protein translocase protein TatB [Salinicola halimionae]|uniref:Sec-independent protein translocase protein TatB n=1 Tax=Salinicola halimionae TaxID=1949081 RepID=UPI000DA24642|nr:Sec-independent protein translocase protein TatB [Salinicola halimionae]
MFDIGFFELLLIGIVGLLVLGPERLPRAARTAGLWVGRIKRSVSTMQREITSQLEAEELRQKLAEQQKKLDEGVNQARRGVESSLGAGAKSGESGTSTPARASAPPPAATDSHDPVAELDPVESSSRDDRSLASNAQPADTSPADKDPASR